MAQISNLKLSITQMDDTEAFEVVREVRFLRRQIPQKTTKASSGKTKKPISAKAALSAMTPEQRADLIKELEGL